MAKNWDGGKVGSEIFLALDRDQVLFHRKDAVLLVELSLQRFRIGRIIIKNKNIVFSVAGQRF